MTPTKKQLHTIERELNILFSDKAFIKVSTIDAWNKLGPFHPTANTPKGSLFLSDQGINSFEKICRIAVNCSNISELSTFSDIYTEAKKVYEQWLRKEGVPSASAFFNEIITATSSQIKTYKFAAQMVGFNLPDSEELLMGPAKILKTGETLLKGLNTTDHPAEDLIQEQFSLNYILTSSAKGTAAVAENRFHFIAALCVGILVLYGTIRYRHVFSNSRVRVLTTPKEGVQTTHLLKWDNDESEISLSTSWGYKPPLSFNQGDVEYFTSQCFLPQILDLLVAREKNEVEEAIVRSLYWFSDAYRDNTPTMRFIKLWSAAECFFAFDHEKISDANATGMAVLLVFSGYSIEHPDNYAKTKSRIKKLYQLRSKAIHRAIFDHIDEEHVNEMSHWIAWIIISIASLADRGYQTLREIHAQSLRLDSVISKTKDGRTVT